MKKVNVAVVGATGMVGRNFLKILEERDFPIDNLYLFSSAKSAGCKLTFRGKEYEVEELTEESGHLSLPLPTPVLTSHGPRRSELSVLEK